MAWEKVERQLTLINELLGAARPIPAEELRRKVGGYPTSTESFKRAFERDKQDLRDMGLPIQVESILGTDPPTVGYRIRPQDYALGDPGLEPDELEALNLAAAVVGSPGGMGQRALFKLGGSTTAAAGSAEIPADPDLVAAFTGVSERRSVRFVYLEVERTVDPYRLEFARGRWYLLGWDHGRRDHRWFRMSRIASGVELHGPAGAFERPTVPLAGLDLTPWAMGGEGPPVRAEVWFDPAIAATVRAEIGDHELVRDDPDGLVVALDVTNREGFRSWVLSFLDRAEVLGPADLRAELVEWLQAVAGG